MAYTAVIPDTECGQKVETSKQPRVGIEEVHGVHLDAVTATVNGEEVVLGYFRPPKAKK